MDGLNEIKNFAEQYRKWLVNPVGVKNPLMACLFQVIFESTKEHLHVKIEEKPTYS